MLMAPKKRKKVEEEEEEEKEEKEEEGEGEGAGGSRRRRKSVPAGARCLALKWGKDGNHLKNQKHGEVEEAEVEKEEGRPEVQAQHLRSLFHQECWRR